MVSALKLPVGIEMIVKRIYVTVHTPLSREVFWHEYAKIPRTYKPKIPLPQAIWNEFWLSYCERSEQ